uniref:Uncharacterized protein n=1 Tax=Setaria viridis TaxID=4556 RepID=A0A4U6UV94_SETVI|nr:hypothetical protein SEVIR_4G093700v2 [Setaria viridis]
MRSVGGGGDKIWSCHLVVLLCLMDGVLMSAGWMKCSCI